MYEVYMDGGLIYYPGDEEILIVNPKIELALNDAGTFEFDMPESNPGYNTIKNRVSMIRVMKDGKEIFYGEVRECEKDIDKIRHVYCVGELAFLFDSIQRPAEYHNKTPRQILQSFLNVHNAQVEEKKRFEIGTVTISDPNDSMLRYTNYENTLDAIREKFIDKMGGYLRVRKQNGHTYLDYVGLSEYGKTCVQKIKFGANLLDYSENISAHDIATAVIPLGAKLEKSPIKALDAYTDIKSVNGGIDYVCVTEAVNRYGWIYQTVHFDDVTEPSNLKRKGEEWLRNKQYEDMVLNLTAIDLSILNTDFDSFNLGDTVWAIAEPFGMNRSFPVQKMSIYLMEHDKNEISLGNTIKKSYTQQASDANKLTYTEMDRVKKTAEFLQSAIDNATLLLTAITSGHVVTKEDEILIMDTDDPKTAKKIWRWNLNGFGYSRDGINGPYKTAITMDGAIVAEFISAGILNGMVINGSVINGAEINGGNIEIGNNDIGCKTKILSTGKIEHYIYDNYMGTVYGGRQTLSNGVKLDGLAIMQANDADFVAIGKGETAKYIQDPNGFQSNTGMYHVFFDGICADDIKMISHGGTFVKSFTTGSSSVGYQYRDVERIYLSISNGGHGKASLIVEDDDGKQRYVDLANF